MSSLLQNIFNSRRRVARFGTTLLAAVVLSGAASVLVDVGTSSASGFAVTYSNTTSTRATATGTPPTGGTGYESGQSVSVAANTLTDGGDTFEGWCTADTSITPGTCSPGTSYQPNDTFNINIDTTLYPMFGSSSSGVPVVTSLDVTSGPAAGGTTVMITGSGFLPSGDSVTMVTFGSAIATNLNVMSDTSLTITSPPGTASPIPVDVIVSNEAGPSAVSAGDEFTYVAPSVPVPAPTVSSLSVSAGPAAGGTVVNITGSGFVSGGTISSVAFGVGSSGPAVVGRPNVVFNNATAVFTVNSDTSITATAPVGTASTTPVDVIVTNATGPSATGTFDQFTYDGTPTVSSLSVATGPDTGATSVIITGTSFLTANQVTFGGTSATYTVDSDTSITASSPAKTASSTPVDVIVTNTSTPGTSAATINDQFTYTQSATHCQPGTSSSSGLTPCSPCTPGTYASTTSDTFCTPASPGSYVAASGAFTSTSCAPGTFSALSGSSGCTSAAAGSFVAGAGASSSTLCAPGTYSSTDGATSCTATPAGSFALTGATAPTLCFPGTYSSAGGASSCTVTTAGSYALAGATAPTLCAAGTYSAAVGAASVATCVSALIGSYATGPGATAATQCAAGMFSPVVGASLCTAAPAGSYATGPGASASTLCSAGSYSSSAGAASCTAASAGSYVAGTGATSQTLCPSTTTSSVGASSCMSTTTPIPGVDPSAPGSNTMTAPITPVAGQAKTPTAAVTFNTNGQQQSVTTANAKKLYCNAGEQIVGSNSVVQASESPFIASGNATPTAPTNTNPGLYVQVLDGMINVSNTSGTQSFTAGQFGFTPGFQQPPVILPTNPGIQFTPPPSFSNTGGSTSTGGKPGEVDCQVRGPEVPLASTSSVVSTSTHESAQLRQSNTTKTKTVRVRPFFGEGVYFVRNKSANSTKKVAWKPPVAILLTITNKKIGRHTLVATWNGKRFVSNPKIERVTTGKITLTIKANTTFILSNV